MRSFLLCSRYAIGIALLGCSAAVAAIFDCELNGQPVNPANGATYAGKTGIMRCRDRDSGKLVREEEYRDGRAVGYRKSVDLFGKTTVGTYNEQGNRDGELKEYDSEGNLIAEERYVNGSTTGVQTYYYKNRQVRRRTFTEPGKGALASIEYNERAQLMQLRCADRPLLPDDRRLCGFDGRPSELTFYSAKGDVTGQARYENGNRIATTALARGTVARSEEVQGERRVAREHYPEGPLRVESVIIGNMKQSERELAKAGQQIRETRYRGGRISEETLWFLNGQMKSTTRYEREGDRVLVNVDEFWDNGKLRARTIRDERRGYIGVQQKFDEAGTLESELTYESGKLARRRNYKNGRLVLDEEYYEDGSRKSTRKVD